MIRDSSGSSRRNAATVVGAASSSRRAANSNPPATISSIGRSYCRLRELVELYEEPAQLLEAFCPESFRPVALHLGDGLANHPDRRGAARRQHDALRPKVVGIRLPSDI